MTPFAPIYARAVARKGREALEASLPVPISDEALAGTGDDRLLSMMARRIFAAGFVWRVVDAKWPGFEEAFYGFEPEAVAEVDVDALASDDRIIRNRQKIVAVKENAAFVRAVRAEHGSFGRFLATWPCSNIVGLWSELAKRGSRLGGQTAPMFLRFVGKDTFILSTDVVKCLVGAGIVTAEPTSRRALQTVQEAFNAWREETGRPLCQLSRIASNSVD